MLVPVLLYGVLIFWLVYDHGRHREHLEEILSSRGNSVISSVELGIANMGCKRRIQLKNLKGLLKETVSAGSADGIALYEKGEELIKFGDGIDPGSLAPDLTERWTADHFLVGRRLRGPPSCCSEESQPGTELSEEAMSHSDTPHQDGGMNNGGSEARRADPGEKTGRHSTEHHTAGDFLVVAADRAPIRRELQQASQHAIVLGVIGFFMMVAVNFWRLHKGRATQLVTELLLVEERLKMTRERSLSAAGLAHETKNPLGMVRAMSQVLSENGLKPEEIKLYAERIIEEVDRTVSRINEFLKYAHPSLPKPENVPLDAFFTKLQELISEGNGNLVTCDVDGGGLTIRADAGLLRQALFNLLNNAVEAVRVRKEGEDGDYRGKISLRAKRTNDQHCSISVEDNGSGITGEDLSQIFNPYFSGRKDGSGLGLAIVKDIGISHGWAIEARSQYGRGATFVVSHIEIA